ncbi:MAG: hypothetical protein ACLVL2_14275 [Bacteroides cellulosilyticus]
MELHMALAEKIQKNSDKPLCGRRTTMREFKDLKLLLPVPAMLLSIATL